ncbi:MAG: hypothetical protein JW883_04345 [Deltaproteobacteria bacterium]|nr:hypothetical protein [Deltaproteobacteria bacterium]
MDIEGANNVIELARRLAKEIESVQVVQQATERKLRSLRGSMPTLLACEIMGEKVPEGKVAAAKAEILELEGQLQDLTWALKGLGSRETAIKKELKEACAVLHHDKMEKRYDELKAELEIQYDPTLDGDLRQCAQSLGAAKQNEADDFLRELKFKWERKSLVNQDVNYVN